MLCLCPLLHRPWESVYAAFPATRQAGPSRGKQRPCDLGRQVRPPPGPGLLAPMRSREQMHLRCCHSLLWADRSPVGVGEAAAQAGGHHPAFQGAMPTPRAEGRCLQPVARWKVCVRDTWRKPACVALSARL